MTIIKDIVNQVENILPGQINYLRLSITDRCNLRCFYCTPWGGWQKLPCQEILRYEELLRLAGVAAGVGIEDPGHRRRTPGAPGRPGVHPPPSPGSRHRRGLPHHQRGAPGGAGPGPLCHRLAPPQPQPGYPAPGALPGTHRRRPIGRRHGRHRAGRALGFSPIKINCVVLKDFNDDELLDFARLTREPPLPGALHRIHAHGGCRIAGAAISCPWPSTSAAGGPGSPGARLQPATAGPARTFRVPGIPGRAGLHQLRQRPSLPHLQPPAPHRRRLSAALSLRRPELDLKGPLRQGADDAALGRLFREAIQLKDCVSPAPGLALSPGRPGHGQHRRLDRRPELLPSFVSGLRLFHKKLTVFPELRYIIIKII